VLISAKVELDAAHCLADHKSKCYHIHGHRYVIQAFVEGPVLDQQGAASDGMVMDFSVLKHCLETGVYDPADHGLIMDINDPRIRIFFGDDDLIEDHRRHIEDFGCVVTGTENWGQKLLLMDKPPTAENLASMWAGLISKILTSTGHEKCVLARLEVNETPKYAAIWQAPKDQQT
jgi:6-pyruvoyltetrahydropterin/6-carboxytetrahydropterin synthase